MNKIYQYLLNTIFWISRFITLLIFGICFFAVLNAKYLLSETFFHKLIYFSSVIANYFFYWIIDPMMYSLCINAHIRTIFNLKFSLFSNFCRNSQQIDLLLLSIILILFVVICIKIFIKKSLYYNLVAIFVIYYVIYLITSVKGILFLPLITAFVFIISIFINKYIKKEKFLKYVPIIGESFYIDSVVSYITKKVYNKETICFFILIESLIISNMLYFVFPFKNINSLNPFIMCDCYNIDSLEDKIIISSNPDIIRVIDSKNKIYSYKHCDWWCQGVIVNKYKKELYAYDSQKEKLFVMDMENYKVKHEIDFSKYDTKHAAGRLCCDDTYSKLLLVLEAFSAYSIDLNNYVVVEKYKINFSNDGIIYNKYRNSFILTFYQLCECMQEININANEVKNISSDPEQGYIAISNKNKEIYVAFHQQGKIGVYDAKTMILKRKIKSNYVVKNITYDEELNVLIAPSYFTGYVDIFLMDGTDKLLTREFIGYELREARFDYKKENLYVCSWGGIYKKKINIKNLIEKVSHETK